MFNIEEITIIKMYTGFNPDRDKIIATLNDSLPLIEDADISDTVQSVIRKAHAMTEDAFSKLDLSAALDTLPVAER